MAMRRVAARSGEWAQHFSDASCFVEVNSRNLVSGHVCWGSYDGFNFAGWRGRRASRHGKCSGRSTARVLASQAEAIVCTGKHGHDIE